jgi:GDP-mannose transporter
MHRSTADPQAAGEESGVLIPNSEQEDNVEKASAHHPLSSAGFSPEPSQPSTVLEIAAVVPNSVAVIGSACFFSVCSVGMLLVNKCAFTGSSFNSGLILGQNFGTCLLALGICCLTPSFRFSPSMSKFVTWAPQVVLFVGTIVSSAAALAIVNVPTFSVFRNSSSLVVAVLEYIVLKKTVSSHQFYFLVLSILGAVVYGWGDLQFSALGYLYSALHVVIASMSAVAVKKLNVQFSSSLEMSFYNNVGSLPLLFIFAAYEYHASSSQIVISNQKCAAASVPAAFLISLSALISQKLLSATSWMALNNFNKIPVLVLSQFIFSDTYSISQAFGLATSVVASAGYSFSSSMAPGIAFRCFDFFKQRLSAIRTPWFKSLFVTALVLFAVSNQFIISPLLFTSSRSSGIGILNHSAVGPLSPTEGILYEEPQSPPPPPCPLPLPPLAGQPLGKFGTCPPLHSTSVRFANSKKYSIKEISETVMGTGFVAASCKPQGWDYSFVYPRWYPRANEWLPQAFKAVTGDGPAPLCGYDWDQKLHDLFKTDDCDLLLDIGGNIGLSVCPALSRNYRVLAFEPIPVNVELLRTNLWLNGWDVDQVGLVAAGVSSSSGNATIFAPIGGEDNSALANERVAMLNVRGSAAPIFIDLVSIDEYFGSADSTLRDKVRLIKIDVQGHELPVLKGMKNMLSSGQRRFALKVEIDVGLQAAAGYGPKDIENYMLGLGWNAFCGGELVPGSSCGDVIFVHESRIDEARHRE